MARKNLLASLTAPKLTAVNSEPSMSVTASRSPTLPYAGMGALGAVTRSIDDLAARANAAKTLEAKLTSGQVIVELDPELIDASFVADRMSDDDEDYRALRQSIAQQGQDSPILVRPHPTAEGKYQVAFGHRRLRAAKELARPVRAVVRQLTDRDLILAQGQENSARANLSFIERARFAHKLEAAGYDRDTIMQALSVDKTTLSRLISVVSRIPAEIIDAIGPAPGTGRDRWIELATLFHTGKLPIGLTMAVASDSFLGLTSDARFARVLSSFNVPADDACAESQQTGNDKNAVGTRKGSATQLWHHSSGALVLRLRSTERTVVFSIDNRTIPGFADYLLSEMEALVSAYMKTASPPPPTDVPKSPRAKRKSQA